MATIEGQWDCEVDSPIGQQKSVMTIVSKPGGGFAGTNTGPLGSLDITDGTLTGDTARFRMELTAPFPMKLECEATVAGDSMTGTIDTGAFGRFPLKATRRG